MPRLSFQYSIGDAVTWHPDAVGVNTMLSILHWRCAVGVEPAAQPLCEDFQYSIGDADEGRTLAVIFARSESFNTPLEMPSASLGQAVRLR